MFKKIFERFTRKEETKSISELLKPYEDAVKNTTEIALPIKYNTQLDNKAFDKIPPSSQCGYTSIAMVLSSFIPQAANDEFISDMILRFEPSFLNGKSSRFGSMMDNHKKIYEYYLTKYNINKRAVFKPQDATISDIVEGLRKGSGVEFAWMATSHGHFSVIIGYSEIRKSFLVHDPFTKFDFTKNRYSRESGAANWHSISDITPYTNRSSKSKRGYRILYLEDKT